MFQLLQWIQQRTSASLPGDGRCSDKIFAWYAYVVVISRNCTHDVQSAANLGIDVLNLESP